MTIQKTNRMELISLAYVNAIAASIGVQISVPPIDNHSVDGTFISSAGRCPRIDFQLKSSYSCQFIQDKLSYPLDVKNYNDLREDRFSPIILILLVMPQIEAEWVRHGHDATSIQHCAYWLSLSDKPAVSNSSNVTVHFDKNNWLSPDTLQNLLTKAANGEQL